MIRFSLLLSILLFGMNAFADAPAPFPVPIPTLEAPTTFIMLAHRWEAREGYLDLKLDGTFEGSLDGETIYYGLWTLEDDEKTMLLINDPMDEEEFNWHFAVIELSFDALHLRLDKDHTWALHLAD